MKKKNYSHVSHGDVTLVPVASLPEDCKPEAGLIVGHSESGHHHAIRQQDAKKVQLHRAGNGALYLQVKEEAVLEHQKQVEAHPPVTLPVQVYEVRQAREYMWGSERQVTD